MAEDKDKAQAPEPEDAPEVVAHEAAEDAPCWGFSCGTFAEE